jgi:NAD(P)-dependent dehydrogenase (short-subunit alcohol dehydrogenase family)
VRENNMAKSIFDLTGRVVLVTGAGSGMGRAICEAMAESGASVIPVDINENAAKETARLICHYGTRVMPLQADAFEAVDIANTVEKTVREFGTIDVVFAHAAIVDTTKAKIHETNVEEWDRVVCRYLRGILVLMKSVFPIMMKKGRGCFITTSAGTALWPLPPVGDLHLATSYITGKTAAIMLTKLAAKQYGEYGIRANVICPGYHRSLHHEKDPAGLQEMERFILGVTPLKRVGLAKDIKGLAIYLASDSSSFVSGQVFVEDGGFMA